MEPDCTFGSRGFPRDSRITRGPELERILKEGKRIRTRYFDVRVCASPLEHSGGMRVGLIVPKAKHNGVERNRLKRRMKELSRTILLPEAHAVELVLLARADTYRASFAMLSQEVHKLGAMLRQSSGDTR